MLKNFLLSISVCVLCLAVTRESSARLSDKMAPRARAWADRARTSVAQRDPNRPTHDAGVVSPAQPYVYGRSRIVGPANSDTYGPQAPNHGESFSSVASGSFSRDDSFASQVRSSELQAEAARREAEDEVFAGGYNYKGVAGVADMIGAQARRDLEKGSVSDDDRAKYQGFSDDDIRSAKAIDQMVLRYQLLKDVARQTYGQGALNRFAAEGHQGYGRPGFAQGPGGRFGDYDPWGY